MKTNKLLFSILLVFSLLISFALGQSKPNVIIIVADDLGYADMSFLPQAPDDVKKFGTPSLDKLAATGTYFENAYSTSPICSPSRVGLITGRYQQRWGNYWYGEGGLPAKELTLPQALKKLGYATKKIGKTHLNGGPVKYPTDHGFDEFIGFMHHTWDYIRLSQKDVDAYRNKGVKDFGCQVIGPLVRGPDKEEVSYENGFSTEIFADETIEYIKRDRNKQPFYIQLEFNAVHAPTYVVQEEYAKKVGVEYIPFDRNAEKWQFPYWEPTEESHQVFHKRWGHLGEVDPDGRKRYMSQLIAMDDHIGRIIKTLEKENKRDNTIIFFLSDNGGTINMYANNTPLRGYKYMFGEGGIRIPMIVSLPGRLPEGKKMSHLVSAMDIFPTVVELAGGTVPSNLDGISLVSLLDGKTNSQHKFLAWDQGRGQTWALRKGPWKLAHNAGWNHLNFKIVDGICIRDSQEYQYPHGVQLFNLDSDISEQRNLADKNPEIVTQLNNLYKDWKSRMSPPRNNKGELKKPKNKKK